MQQRKCTIAAVVLTGKATSPAKVGKVKRIDEVVVDKNTSISLKTPDPVHRLIDAVKESPRNKVILIPILDGNSARGGKKFVDVNHYRPGHEMEDVYDRVHQLACAGTHVLVAHQNMDF
ncbi:MAG: hypothetical protein WC246_01720 [Candidatus Paceibacterota bacterium]